MRINQNCFIDIGYYSLIVISLIIIYAIILKVFLKTKINDPMINIELPIIGNGWKLSHLLFFMFLGYKYPNCFTEATILGIGWEITEFTVGHYFPIFFPNVANSIDKNWSNWYYGDWVDVIFNTIGFLIGRQIRLSLNKKNKLDFKKIINS